MFLPLPTLFLLEHDVRLGTLPGTEVLAIGSPLDTAVVLGVWAVAQGGVRSAPIFGVGSLAEHLPLPGNGVRQASFSTCIEFRLYFIDRCVL